MKKLLMAAMILLFATVANAETLAGGGGIFGSVASCTATKNYGNAHADWTLTAAEARCGFITTSNADGGVNAILASCEAGRLYLIYNNTGQTLTFKVTGQTGGTIANGKYALYACHATDVIEIFEQG